MTEDELKALQPGDIVRHVSDWQALTVIERVGDVAVAIRTTTITNPDEWVLVSKFQYEPIET